MLNRKRSLWLLLVLIFCLTLSACSESTETGGATPAPAPTQTPPETKEQPAATKEEPEEKVEKPQEPVELIFYSQVPDYDEYFMETFGNLIVENFPHVTPAHLKASTNALKDVVVTGQPIDIMFMSIGQADSLTSNGYQYDISDLIKQYDFDLSHIEPTALELQRGFAEGGLYGLPVFTNTLGLFYNIDLFDKFGVEYPRDGMTWPELMELAASLARTDEGIQYRGLGMSPSANIVLNQYSAAYIDPQTKRNAFLTEPFMNAFKLLTDVAFIPGNGLTEDTWSLGAQQNLFIKDQTTAMFLHFVVYALSFFQDQLNWDIAAYPQLPEEPGMGAQTYPTYFYVTQTSEHKEQAFEVIAYMTSPEFQNHLARRGMLPILKDTVEGMKEFGQDVDYLRGKNVQALIPERFAPSALSSVEVVRAQSPGHSAFFDAYKNMVLEMKDFNTALREAGEAYDQQLAELFKE